jgi:ABC-2 type transport system permease protein
MSGALLRRLRLIARVQVLHLRAQLEYETDFWLAIVGVLLFQLGHLLLIWVAFVHAPRLGGWTVWEALFMYSLTEITKGLHDLLCDGLWRVPYLVHSGSFDLLLLRPRALVFQAATSSARLHGLGNLVLGLGVAIVAGGHLDLALGAGAVAYLGVCLASALVMTGSLTVVGTSAAFWFRGADTAVAQSLWMMVDIAQFPNHIYGRGLQTVITWIVPLAFVGYVPASFLLGKPLPWSAMGYLPPVMALAAAALAALVWHRGVQRYESSGH